MDAPIIYSDAVDTVIFKHLQLKAQVIDFTPRYRGGIVAAVSGGCDSLALLALLVALQREVKFTLAVLHVNFGLRGTEADGDQQHVLAAARGWGLACHVHQVDAADLAQRRGRSLQEWARLIRQRELRHYCQAHDCVAALAQHRDDLAETALYRLIRGADVAQLPGMVRFDAPFWRPLLTLSKACLRSFCAQQGITYRTDSSNRKCIYARNRIRNLVMPQLTTLHHNAAQNIVAACTQARELQATTEHELRTLWQAELQRGELTTAALQALPHCKTRMLLRLLLGNVAQQTVTKVLAQIDRGGKFVRQLRRGLLLTCDGQKLKLLPCVDGVKVARKQQYEQIVRQTRLCFILESGAHAETSDGLCVQADSGPGTQPALSSASPDTAGDRAVAGQKSAAVIFAAGDVCVQGRCWPAETAERARGVFDMMGLKFLSTGNCEDILLESRHMAGDSA